MKSIKTVFIKATCLLALIFLANAFSLTPLNAQSNRQAGTDAKSDIRCISTDGGVLVFELKLHDLPAKGSLLQISDETGNSIFEEHITTATFNVRYKIPRNNISKITFEISGKKLRINRSFSIKSHIEETIEVAKL